MNMLENYGIPARLAPQWYVGYLTFQHGNVRRRTGSLTGGGQVYGHPYSGVCPPVVMAYATPVSSMVAGGQINARPGFLTTLYGSARGAGS